MKLKKLIAKDFRSLKDLEINFPDEQVIAIIGNNGSGKTAVLDAIHLALAQVFYHNKKIDNIKIPKKDRSSKKSSIHLIYEKIEGHKITSFHDTKQSKVILPTPEKEEYPFFIYYTSLRFFENDTEMEKKQTPVIKDTFKNEYEKIEFQKDQINNLLEDIGFKITKSGGRFFKEWFIAETNKENEEIRRRKDFNYTRGNLDKVRTAIDTFFNYLEDERFGTIQVITKENLDKLGFQSRPKPDVYIQKGQFELKFSQLSAGEKTLVYMVADIARRFQQKCLLKTFKQLSKT